MNINASAASFTSHTFMPSSEAVRNDNRQQDLVSPSDGARSSQNKHNASEENGQPRSSTTRAKYGPQQYTQQEQKQLKELSERDREVRQHEQQHKAVGGHLASAPTYDFEKGPDGKQYAVGGEVKIDVAMVPNDPQASIDKMQQVRRAALAPSQPSGADRQVAAKAQRQEMQARAELNTEKKTQNDKPDAIGANKALDPANDDELSARQDAVASRYENAGLIKAKGTFHTQI